MSFLKKNGDQYEIGYWYTGWKSWKFEITYRNHGYESKASELHISMFGWHSVFTLPWCCTDSDVLWREEKKYGISIHSNVIFFHLGYNLKGWDIPFINYGSAIRWDQYIGNPEQYWYQSSKKECWRSAPYMSNYKENSGELTTWTYDYTDPYDNTVVPCKFWVEEMEWRPKWLKWTKLFTKTKRFIEVDFSEEMGPRKDSWKGGVIGCGFNMLSNEHPMETIRRMEKEFEFR